MRPTIVSLALVLFATTLVVVAPSEAADNASGPKTWAIEGVMTSACQCTVFCACEFNEKPTFGHCDDSELIRITKGHYGGVNLDGQRIIVISQSPKGERLVDAVGKLNFARLYVDESASEAQAEALAALARKIFGAFVEGSERISSNEKVQRAKLDVVIETDRHRIKIPGVLDLEIEPLRGGDGKTPMAVKNHTFSAFGMGDPEVWRSKTYTFKGDTTAWDYSGRNASVRTLKMSGEI
ncbi:MAG TPA: DUF1326 domain-containing protein [Thermoanaerobaculia bacterium]